jgi:hypothetical protein
LVDPELAMIAGEPVAVVLDLVKPAIAEGLRAALNSTDKSGERPVDIVERGPG